MPEILFVMILLMIIGALIAIESSKLLYSVISIGAVGFLLSIVFLFLSAPDLAITQIAVEVITLALLLRAVKGSAGDASSDRPGGLTRTVAVVMLLALAFFARGMFSEFPAFGEPVIDRFADAPSNTYLAEGLEATGAANVVTSVLLDFRAYDTLGEATVLFCAVLGALCVLRRTTRNRPGDGDEAGEG